jgi:cytochrome d ubiquinol oxidase subunit II
MSPSKPVAKAANWRRNFSLKGCQTTAVLSSRAKNELVTKALMQFFRCELVIMETLFSYLPDIWYLVIGFLLLYYVVVDGYDLGIGIISLFARGDAERGLMMASIQENWHANQTWLVLLGGILFGAFPLFYGIILAALYIPMLIMLIGLIFRGVAFEFRATSKSRRLWGLSFGTGSLVTALAQGFAVGGLFSGLEVAQTRFVGSIWQWLNPFSFIAAAGVIAGYVMLGANFLILKCTGDLQNRAYTCARVASWFTVAISIVVYTGVAMRYPFVVQKWVRSPVELSVFPSLAVLSLLVFYRAIRKRREIAPLIANIAFILFGFVGISVGLYPFIIPNVVSSSVSIHHAAASPKTLFFMLIVMSLILPVILVYSGYKIWVFRGKTEREEYRE